MSIDQYYHSLLSYSSGNSFSHIEKQYQVTEILTENLHQAAKKGDIDTIEYIFTNVNLFPYNDLGNYDQVLNIAIKHGHADLIEFLITIKDDYCSCAPYLFYQSITTKSCYYNQPHILTQLLSLHDFSHFMHFYHPMLLESALKIKQFSILRFLIFDFHMDKNPQIETIINLYPEEKNIVEYLFNIRQLNKKLHETLLQQTLICHKNKI